MILKFAAMLKGDAVIIRYVLLVSMTTAVLGSCNETECESCIPYFPEGMLVHCTNKHLTGLPELPYNVYELKLSHNSISVLKTGMFNITELTQRLTLLFLDNNKITEIQSSAFLGVNKLKHLDLSHNINLKSLNSGALLCLSSLQYLDLQNTGLVSLAQGVFKSVPVMEILLLPFNNFSNIPPNSFEGTRELKILDFSNNNIKTLEKNAFSGAANLTHLNLSSNLITNIERSTFQPLVNIRNLKLTYNKLVTIDTNVLQPLQQLHLLELEGNQWDCTCSASNFYRWIQSFHGNVTGPLCATPQFLIGKGDLGHLSSECYIHCPKHEPKENCWLPPTTAPPINLNEVIPRLTNLVYISLAFSAISVGVIAAASMGIWLIKRQQRTQSAVSIINDSDTE
ncbi:reticulon-4 receptor-like [Protopterus annectens]|uniref:reticulon-4 receptor-like n=1 Tax=Protopterus annectens TaxID=7888 RepID=UPI001CFBC73E|nr:reticulon-4 receptor-like [Protopterus annectens]